MTRMSLGDAFLLNPYVPLPKGTVAPFVEMGAFWPDGVIKSRKTEVVYEFVAHA